MLKVRVAIRVDASIAIGTGHVMRCLTLADALRRQGAEVLFLARAHEGHLDAKVREHGHAVAELPARRDAPQGEGPPHRAWLGTSGSQDAADCAAVLTTQAPIDWLIVDHYALDASWERALRRYAPRLMVIDDLADRDHDCDVLLDPNIHANQETRYAGRVPRGCRLLLGPQHSLLREEFDAALRGRQRTPRTELRRLLILFGGVDAGNETLAAIQVVEQLKAPTLRADVVIAPRNRHAAAIRAYCATRPAFTVHEAPKALAELMASADLAIGAGGTTTFERLYLRLPALLKPASANQEAPLAEMSRMGLFRLYRDGGELLALLQGCLRNGVETPPACVANGTAALVQLLLTDAVQLVPPRPLDLRRTFRWLQDQQLRADFMVAEAPQRAGHFRYWRRLLADSSQMAFSIIHRGRHAGNCGLKNIERERGLAELWIYLGEAESRGQGLGRAAAVSLLNLFRARCAGRTVYLHLRRDNAAARALYLATGFTECARPLEGAWAGREAEMLRMEIAL